MESNKILQADFLDILFEDRNKEYGAYDLRKTYNKRLFKSIAAMGTVIVLLFVGGIVLGRGTKKVAAAPYVFDDTLIAINEPDVTPPPQPPPPKIEVPQVATIQWTKPKIVPDADKPDPPPTVDDLDKNVKIAASTKDGNGDADIVAPQAGEAAGKGIVEEPKKVEEPAIWTKVEIESTYPEGAAGWLRFLNKNLHYPDDALNNGIDGVVMVQFIVDEKGNVSNVQAVSGPELGGLREEAVFE